MPFAFVDAASTKTKTVTKSVTAGNLLVCCFACGDGTAGEANAMKAEYEAKLSTLKNLLR
jgi:hypothetical protein